jgi:hypothetical protein
MFEITGGSRNSICHSGFHMKMLYDFDVVKSQFGLAVACLGRGLSFWIPILQASRPQAHG